MLSRVKIGVDRDDVQDKGQDTRRVGMRSVIDAVSWSSS